MRRTLFPIVLSIVGLLLTSFSLNGIAQKGNPALPGGLLMPEALAGFPGTTAEWWAAAQDKLVQDLGEAEGLSVVPDWTAVGEASGDVFGYSVAPAGDVNSDGYADLAVGAWGYDLSSGFNEGKAYVYYGSASGLNLTPDWSAVGEDTNIYFGYPVASAGDVNGHGYDDLAVGAPSYNSGTGKVYIYLGSANGLSITADWSAIGEAASNYFGQSVSSAGDVNGDGYADLAVGAYLFNTTGKAYVYHGSTTGLSTIPTWSAVGEDVNNLFGYSVASAGDMNGDGYADLAVGAYGYDIATGKVYVYHGSANGLSITPNWSVFGETEDTCFGQSVASAGDVNGDGYADLAAGAPCLNMPGQDNNGKVYVYHGSVGSLKFTPDWSAVGEGENSYFGESVASVGDVNGDGYDDLAIGASGYNTSTGKAYVYHGSTNGLSITVDWSAVGEDIYDRFGYSVASAGDVNGDGYADLVVGAFDFNNIIGKAYNYYGSAGPAGCTVYCLWVTALDLRDILNGVRGVVSIQDENGIAVPRAAVSAHWDLPGGGALDQTKITNTSGSVTFKVAGGAGAYTITVTNVAKTGYTFDPVNSTILTRTITK